MAPYGRVWGGEGGKNSCVGVLYKAIPTGGQPSTVGWLLPVAGCVASRAASRGQRHALPLDSKLVLSRSRRSLA